MTNAAHTIEVFTDFVCPWCYLGNAVVNEVVRDSSIALRRTFFPLHPSTPPEGLLIADLLAGRDLTAIHERLHSEMDKLGLPHGDRQYTYNSRLAQELALWADTQREGRPLDKLIYEAYFVHDQNIAHKDVLLPLVEAAGLDVGAAETVLESRSFSSAVDAEWNRARQFGVSGIPTFVYRGYASSGYLPAEQLREFMQFVQQKTAPST